LYRNSDFKSKVRNTFKDVYFLMHFPSRQTSVETQKSDSEAEKFRENELENEHSNRSARNGSDESDEGDVIEYSLSSRFTSKLEETWKTCVDLKDFLLITAAVFIVSIAAALMQSNFLFALRYVFLIEGSSLSLFLQTGMAIVSLPLWFLYMKRVGKNKAFLTSCVMLAVPLLFLCFLPAGYETVILFLAGFFGFANAAPLIVQVCSSKLMFGIELCQCRSKQILEKTVTYRFGGEHLVSSTHNILNPKVDFEK
tara:strand:+ start:1769 stop:2530 length:762 start_codon:yes stop_codon:yes gene_type:complete